MILHADPGFTRLRAAFDRVPGYLDAATMGLPPRVVVQALREQLDDWQTGGSTAPAFDAAVTASRQAYARLVGVDPSVVAVGSQVSPLTGLIAAGLPDGAEVVTVEGDFASVVFPFLVHADRGVTVRHVPLEGLADAIRPGTSLVAFSLVQSGDGRVADATAIREAADAAGARTFCDLTQAAGWLPVRAGDFDVTVCGTYKWLCCPRGTAFLTVAPGYAEGLRPLHAGWYAGRRFGTPSTVRRCGWPQTRGGSTSRPAGPPGSARHRHCNCSPRPIPGQSTGTTPSSPTRSWPGSAGPRWVVPWSPCPIRTAPGGVGFSGLAARSRGGRVGSGSPSTCGTTTTTSSGH